MEAIVKGRRKPGKRDQEIVIGWPHYYKIARSIGGRWLSYYFPTNEDLEQSAALAATVAQSIYGEQAVMGLLTPVLARELREQAKAYGMRQANITRPDGTKANIKLKREVSFAAFADEDDNSQPMAECLESRMMAVGVGEWTMKHSRFLHELMH